MACFASHVHRVQQVLDAAAAHGRRVCLVGRSMVRNMGIAAELGFLNVPDGLLVELDDAMELPDEQVVIVSTGSQGEPLSALSRMARGEHRSVRIRAEDTIILASSLIPGNESAVFGVINGLTRLGATRGAPGHREGARVRPRVGRGAAVPVQRGAAEQRDAGARRVAAPAGQRRARRARPGCAEERVVLAEDGVVVDLVDGKAAITGRVEVGRVYVDGLAVGDIGESTLGDRLILGEGGFISITVAVDSTTGRAVSARRCPGAGSPTTRRRWTRCCRWSRTSWRAPRPRASPTPTGSRSPCAGWWASWVGETYRRRPMIVPTVIAV